MKKKTVAIIMIPFFAYADESFIKKPSNLLKKKPYEIKESIAYKLGNINRLCTDIIEKSAQILRATIDKTYDLFEQEKDSFFTKANAEKLSDYECMLDQISCCLRDNFVSLTDIEIRIKESPKQHRTEATKH